MKLAITDTVEIEKRKDLEYQECVQYKFIQYKHEELHSFSVWSKFYLLFYSLGNESNLNLQIECLRSMVFRSMPNKQSSVISMLIVVRVESTVSESYNVETNHTFQIKCRGKKDPARNCCKCRAHNETVY